MVNSSVSMEEGTPCLLVKLGTFLSVSSNKNWYAIAIENLCGWISSIHVPNVSQELVNPSRFSASSLSTDAYTGARFEG